LTYGLRRQLQQWLVQQSGLKRQLLVFYR